MFNTTPRPLCPLDREQVPVVPEWVPRDSLDWCGKFHPLRDSIIVPFRPNRVAIPSKLHRPVKFKGETSRCYVRSIIACCAESVTRRKVEQKYLKYFGVWCWKRMEKISWKDFLQDFDRVKNEILQRVKEERKILRTIQ